MKLSKINSFFSTKDRRFPVFFISCILIAEIWLSTPPLSAQDKPSSKDFSEQQVEKQSAQKTNPVGAEKKKAENPPSNKDNENSFDWSKLIFLVLGGLIGGGFKFLFDEWQKKREKHRRMMESVTKNIEELAKKYYWLLANNSSVLGGILEDYLRKREEVQLFRHTGKTEMQRELSHIQQRYANDAFFYYSKLMHKIYEFQWVTGNTYFLKDYWSGKSITKLYNRLISVMTDIDANVIIDFIDREEENPDQNGGKLDTIRSFIRKVDAAPELQDVYHKFNDWMAERIELVWEASNCLKAYSHLFNYELAILYEDWFKPLKIDVNEETLVRTNLDQQTRETILRVISEPLTLRPISIYSPSAAAGEKRKTEKEDEKIYPLEKLAEIARSRLNAGETLDRILTELQETYGLKKEQIDRIIELLFDLRKVALHGYEAQVPQQKKSDWLQSYINSYSVK